MLSRRLAASARPLASSIARHAARAPLVQSRQLSADEAADLHDPNMNGGYVNPPPIKRQHRDPYGDWWDKQQRRNFGEPVHEDEDIMGMFATEDYSWTTPGKGAIMLGTFVATLMGLLLAVNLTYPDIPSAPREYEGGLERELGGPSTVRARKEGDSLLKGINLEQS